MRKDFLGPGPWQTVLWPRCEGARGPVSEAALDAALQKGGAQNVTRLYRNQELPDDRCWLKAPGFALAYS